MLLPFLGAVSLAFIIYAMLAYGTTKLFGSAFLVLPLHMAFVAVVIYSAVILLSVNPITVFQVGTFILMYMTWRRVNIMAMAASNRPQTPLAERLNGGGK